MRKLAPILAFVFSLVVCASGSIVSKAARESLEKAAREGVKKSGAGALETIAKKFGPEAATKAAEAAKRAGVHPSDALAEIARHGKKIYRRYAFDPDAIAFGLQHGDAGRYLMHKFDFNELRLAGWTKPEAKEAVEKAFDLVGPTPNGSWKELRNALTKANITNGRGRDFCEKLFIHRARAGKIPTISKNSHVFDGHIPGRIDGMDVIVVDEHGLVRVIEFSTGRKPSPGNPLQLTEDKVREQLANWIDVSPKDQLRAAGFPQALLNPANLKDPKFPLSEYLSREFFAPEVDRKAAEAIGAKVYLLL